MNEENKEVLKVLGRRNNFKAEFNEFHALGILFMLCRDNIDIDLYIWSFVYCNKKVMINQIDHIFCLAVH